MKTKTARFSLTLLFTFVLGCGQATAVAPAGPRIHEPNAGSGIAVATPEPVAEAVIGPVAVEPAAAPIAGAHLLIPQLGIDLLIVEGAGGASEPLAGFAAHYPGTGWPGSGLGGLFYSHARPGMFGALLNDGAVGEKVEIELPSGRVLTYTITSFTRSWPVTRPLTMATHEELILYTCTSWVYSDPKVVAVAEPS